MRDTMRTRKPKGKAVLSRADDQRPHLQRSSTNVTASAMPTSHQNSFDAAFAAAVAAAVHNTAPLVDILPQPKPYRRPCSRVEPHKMQSTMRKNPPKLPMRPSRAERQALLPISEDLPIIRARSNNSGALALTPKPKDHAQLTINIRHPKPTTYSASPMPILKRSNTEVHHDSLREVKNDQNGLVGDGDFVIQTIEGFIQQRKSKGVERKRQKEEKVVLPTKQSWSLTPTSQQTVPVGSVLEPTAKRLGPIKVQHFKDRVAAMLLWHQQRTELKRDIKREVQNSKLKAKISRPFNIAQGVRDHSYEILEDNQKLLISKQSDARLAFGKDMPVGLGITLEQTRRAPLIDLPIPNGSKAMSTQSAVNDNTDNVSIITRFSDIIRLADEPAKSRLELPKVAAKDPIKTLKVKEPDRGPVPVSRRELLIPVSEHIHTLTNPVEHAGNHGDVVQGRAIWKIETGYRGIHDLIQKSDTPSPSIYSTRGSRQSSMLGSPQILQDEIENFVGLPTLRKRVSETLEEKNLEYCLPFLTAGKRHTNAKETPELMNMDKVGCIADEVDHSKAVGRNTAFYDFYDDILIDN